MNTIRSVTALFILLLLGILPSATRAEEETTITQQLDQYNVVWTTQSKDSSESMAGGMGGFFGFYPNSPHPYPNPEQLCTHYTFWHETARFLLDMQPSNKLADAGYVLRSASKRQYIFYIEDTSSVQLNLTGAVGKLPAVAVDTKKAYREIDLGTLESKVQQWKAPYRSDWAIAIGDFGSRN